ncbi:MAG: (E)-4-hydroxy-3-methylbut-2-enyl-diphosphate synthase [Bacteroidales bacterium]|nr:(E)-4-hydroxy-3-methylbut-2-enyl-diphosphate synthase [Bacteroidales bacterium]
MEYISSLTNYNRNVTNEVKIGGVKIGGDNEIVVQTMCNTPTDDVEKTVAQIIGVVNQTGCKIVRVTVPSMKDVEALKAIHERINGICALVADVHFNAQIAFECAKIVEKVRVNPGNFGHHELACLTEDEFRAEGKLLEDTFRDFLKVCREHGTAVRIGTNHGSLAKRILNRYGDTPEGMVESVMEFLRVAKAEDFKDVAISLKSSNPTVAIRAARLMVKAMKDEGMDYCLHLGVTEAGEGDDGRIKSASGICPLLNDGIGDTIRVSLTEDPENEILPAQEIVAYKDYVSKAEKLPEIPFFYDPYHYHKRKSNVVSIFGGDNPAAVAITINNESELMKLAAALDSLVNANKKPDLVICNDGDIVAKCRALLRGIMIFDSSETADNKGVKVVYVNEKLECVECGHPVRQWQAETPALQSVIIAEPQSRNKTAAMRLIFNQLKENNINCPVLLKPDGGEQDARFKKFAPAAVCAGVFIDGFGDGVCLESNGDPVAAVEMAFKILQISRLRVTETEYVSCPGCGRTMYDLQGTVKRIKAATSKYCNLKIAVMGCIVNGPGEMADADFGYVGAGRGKIALYKAGELVKRAIPEENAVDELIKLIENSK